MRNSASLQLSFSRALSTAMAELLVVHNIRREAVSLVSWLVQWGGLICWLYVLYIYVAVLHFTAVLRWMNEWMVYFCQQCSKKLCASTIILCLWCPVKSCKITRNTRHNKTKYALIYSSQVYHISIIWIMKQFALFKLNRDLHKFTTEPVTRKHLTWLHSETLNLHCTWNIKPPQFRFDVRFAMATSKTQKSSQETQRGGGGKWRSTATYGPLREIKDINIVWNLQQGISCCFESLQSNSRMDLTTNYPEATSPSVCSSIWCSARGKVLGMKMKVKKKEQKVSGVFLFA